MANEQNELTRVNWNEVFGFSDVFKSFRMAIHPSKLLLALAAVAAICLAGWLLDRMWGLGNAYVQRDAIAGHVSLTDRQYDDVRRAWQDSRTEKAAAEWERAVNQKRTLSVYMGSMTTSVTGNLNTVFSDLVREENRKEPDWKSPDSKDVQAVEAGGWAQAIEDAKREFEGEVSRIEQLLEQAREDAEKAIAALTLSIAKQDEVREQLENDLRQARYALTARRQSFNRTIQNIRGQGIFHALLSYDRRCFANATLALCRGDIRGGLAGYQADLHRKREDTAQAAAPVAFPEAGRGGVIYWSLMACHGCCWLLTEHWVFAGILLVISLAVWSLFGGAIHRIAALQAAREEKISIRQALRFSAGKFFSFFTAPLIPLAGIVLIGLAVAAGGLIGNLWGLGAFLIGLLFGLAALAGLIIAFLFVGLATGVGLMYPTIAVEGSDSFDAISRSFSYVFAKPWRALLYALMALVHGAVCYGFVRGFAFIALKSTHFWAKVGIWQGGQTLLDATDKLDIMWPAPTFAELHAPVPSEALSGMEYVGALLIAFWVYIIIALLGAFVLSYASSAATVIYYLLRRRVDATDLDDVYVEEAEEEQPPAEETPPEPQQESGQDEKSEQPEQQ